MPYWFDGNNLIGQSAAQARADRKTRAAFLTLLGTLSRARAGRFLVYFDGDDPDRALPPRGVQVRYSAPLSTDDFILQRLSELTRPSEIIVVTNDRTLTSRCRSAGAKAMDWWAFLSRARAGSSPDIATAEKDERINLDEWIQYFGLDKGSLK